METLDSTAFLIDADQCWMYGIASIVARGDQLGSLLHLLDVALEEDQPRYGPLRQPSPNLRGSFEPVEPANDYVTRDSFELVHFVGTP